MAEINKPDMSSLWASGGASIAPTSEKVQRGWVAEIPPHQWQNWWQNRADSAIGYMFQHGIPEWDAGTEYFMNKSIVQVNGALYRAITNNIGQNPTTSAANWETLVVQVGMQVFMNPGTFTFTKPSGVKFVKVRVWGAGGGGASDNVVPGPSGGGQGGYWEGVFDISNMTTVPVTVGQGGAGAAITGTNGSAGGSSSFGAFCSAGGGEGGTRASNASGGGSASGTTGWGYQGGFGSVSLRDSYGTNFLGGAGGGFASPFGVAGNTRPGAPGMGGAGRVNTAAAPGAHGAVIVEW